MASYGVFLAACGFEYHGPQGHIGFAPRLTPENFKAAFTTAEGWGTFSQRIAADRHEAEVHLKFGKLRLRSLALAVTGHPEGVEVSLDGKSLKAQHTLEGNRLLITLAEDVELGRNASLKVSIS
jgi:non-lysosomal glucosylceramidase